MLGFFVMFIVLCIVVGQCGLDTGKKLRGRDEARKKGEECYVDGKGVMRSSRTGKHVELRNDHNARFLYDGATGKILYDYKEDEYRKRNKELMQIGADWHFGIVWYNVWKEVKKGDKIDTFDVGNCPICIENDTGRPFVINPE